MTMMSCRDVGLRLQSFLDDELDPGRMERIRKHLDACVDCGLEFDINSKIKAEITARREETDPAVLDRLRDFARGISDRVEAEHQV